MKEALVLCVISALLPGFHGAIMCSKCQLWNDPCDTRCTGDACIAVKYSSADVSGTYKDCATSAQCNPRSITLSTAANRHILINTACCTSDNCTDSLTLSEPPMGDFKNGVNCPVCEKLNETPCKSTVSLACTGLEEKCITLIGKTLDSSQNFSLKGCASRNACNMQSNDFMAYNGTMYILDGNATCTDRGTLSALSSPATVFLPAMLGYLLVNMLPDL